MRSADTVAGVAPGQSAAAAKTALRDQILTARGRRSLLELREDADAIAHHLLESLPVRRAATVAAYVSVGREPGTGPLLEGLRAAGKRVVVPVLLGDNDLDWAVYAGPDALFSGGRGTLEPAGPRLGPDSIATADVVLTPGLAVSAEGHRLGRGGGSYDRALGRVPVGTFTCTLLYDGEWPVDVPLDPHDRPVAAVATPRGVSLCRFPGAV
jgi:5-formyltetrahydrofolate cyclo-ligase